LPECATDAHLQKARAYAFFASSFLSDAKYIAARGWASFNITSVTDTGGFLHHATLATDGEPPLPGSGIHSTAYFAVGHAIELFLKSFLLARGLSEERIRKELRHDLAKAAKLVTQFGLRLPSPGRIVEFSEYHRRQLFRYPLEPLLVIPSLVDLITIAEELEELVRDTLRKA
jgi:hypothetical protein